MERAAISVPANIAEGYGRGSRAEYLHFLSIAAGSLRELETHVLIAQQNGLVSVDATAEALAVADETGRILHALRKSLVPKARRADRWPG
jgi:four helix bundle protein